MSLWPGLLDGNAREKVTAGISGAESFLMEKPLGNTLLGLLAHTSVFVSWVPIDASLRGLWLLLGG